MRISSKLVLAAVFVLAGTIFYQGCQKEAQTVVKPAKSSAKEAAKAPAKEEKLGLKDVNAVKPVEKKEEPIKEANAPAAAKPVETNDIAVTVNGSVITEAEVDARLKPYLERAAGRIDPNMLEQYKKRLKAQALDGMILERIMDEQVKNAGITVSDSDVNEKIGELLTQQGMTIDGLKSLLTAQGQSFDEFNRQMKKGLAYEKFVDKQVGPVEINDADALEYYKQNEEDYNTPEQVRASHILLKVAQTATEEEKAAAKTRIEKLLKEIKEGSDFATLARENSDCPSKVKGGDLGFFERGAMVKPFEDAAFGMKPGQMSDVIETQFGYHIIKVTDRKTAGVTPFEKEKPEIIKTLQQVKKGESFRKYIAKLKAEAKVVYPPGKEPMPLRPMGPTREVEMAPKPE
jgi:peptidyl-prolyl cis-trans isomerase C